MESLAGADLSKTPAGKPPPGQVSNLVDPPSLQPATLGLIITLMVIGIAFALVSFVEHSGKRGWSDYFSLTAVFFSIPYCILVFSYSSHDVHQWDLPISELIDPSSLKKSYAQNILLGPCLFFAKAAILALYLRIFSVNRALRFSVYCGFLLDFLAYFPQPIIPSVLCAPHIGHPWNIEVQIRCGNSSLIWGLVSGGLGVLLDLFLFIVPIPVVARLNMSAGKKWGIIGVFNTASLGVVASICSEAYRAVIYETPQDSTWYAAALEICIMVEIWIGIIVGATPGVASKFKHVAIESSNLSIMRSRLASLFRTSQKSSAKDGGSKQQYSSSYGFGAREQSGNDYLGHPDGSSQSYARLADSTEQMELQDRPLPEDAIGKVTTFHQKTEPRMDV